MSPRGAHLVLVGGGHSHVQVLRRLAMERREGRSLHAELTLDEVQVTLVVDDPVAIYSGMVPGYVAGQYRRNELEIDVVPLARMAGVTPVLHAARGIDAANRQVLLEGRPPLRYDLISLDIGSTVAGLDLPGVREYALSSRPISNLVDRVREAVEACPAGQPRILVVGAGAGGVELAFTLQSRLHKQSIQPAVTLLHAGDDILPGSAPSLVRRARAAARRRGIEVATRRRVQRVLGEHGRARAVELDDGTEIPADLVVWVTGATAHPNFDPGDLPTDERGFLSTRPTLQVEGHDDVFAVGDCATLRATPTPKAGVYAVRQGPVLSENLGLRMIGRRLETYTPQSDFLALLNLGDGTALGSKWSFSFEGRWVMRLKDRIDRKFMRRFQVLEVAHQHEGQSTDIVGASPSVRVAEGFRQMAEEMDLTSMHCGGCAAKLEQSALETALERLRSLPSKADRRGAAAPGAAGPSARISLRDAGDVAAWSAPGGDLIVRSVDAFRAFTDDPWLVGRVAALNALSDLYSAGARPSFAMALVGLPLTASRSAGGETLFQVLAGAQETFEAADVELLGGHTTLAQELWVGFSVDGLSPPGFDLAADRRPRPGDQLVLTKALGSGVLLHAHMLGRLPGRAYAELVSRLVESNRAAGELLTSPDVSAGTDVTGFGLLGHLLALVANRDGAPPLRAHLDSDRIPALPGARAALSSGLHSTAHPANALRLADVDADASVPSWLLDLLCDPQTSGGLLIAVREAGVAQLVDDLQQSGTPAHVIGSVIEASTDPASDGDTGRPIRID